MLTQTSPCYHLGYHLLGRKYLLIMYLTKIFIPDIYEPLEQQEIPLPSGEKILNISPPK